MRRRIHVYMLWYYVKSNTTTTTVLLTLLIPQLLDLIGSQGHSLLDVLHDSGRKKQPIDEQNGCIFIPINVQNVSVDEFHFLGILFSKRKYIHTYIHIH